MKKETHPNMLGLSIFAGILAAIMSVLLCREIWSGRQVPDLFTDVLFIALLFLGSAVAYRVHARLKAMAPEQRNAYWRRVEETAEKNAREFPPDSLG